MKKKKSGRLWKVLLVLTVVFVAGSAGSAVLCLQRARETLAAVREVEYTRECLLALQKAQEAVDALDGDLGLDLLVNTEGLKDCQAEYVRLAIREVYVGEQEGEAADVLLEKIRTARGLFNAWFTEAELDRISNYADLTEAESRNQEQPEALPLAQEEEELELCG